jgi:hypothetical protein
MSEITHYQGSDGSLKAISDMPYSHLKAAHAKLVDAISSGVQPSSRMEEAAAMGARLDVLAAEYSAANSEGPPAAKQTPAAIGHNNPPPDPTGFPGWEAAISDLMLEVGNVLDGAGITTDDEATYAARVRSNLKRLSNGFELARKEEKRPFDEGAAGVQARYTPLQNKLKTADGLFSAAETRWLNAKADLQAKAAAAARVEADKIAAAARAAVEAARQAADIGAAEEAEALVKQAAAAAKNVTKLERAPVQITGGDRARGLKTYLVVSEITSNKDALDYCKKVHTAELLAWIKDRVDKDARAGIRTIPGCTITEERRVA